MRLSPLPLATTHAMMLIASCRISQRHLGRSAASSISGLGLKAQAGMHKGDHGDRICTLNLSNQFESKCGSTFLRNLSVLS